MLAKTEIEGCSVVVAKRGYDVFAVTGEKLGSIDKRAMHELRWCATRHGAQLGMGTASTWAEAVRFIRGAHGL